MSYDDNTYYGHVSPQLDELSSTLMGDALDMLAEGEELGVLLVMHMRAGEVESLRLSDDGADKLLQAARDKVRGAKGCERYALVYEGAVEVEDGAFADAIILEFGEHGCPSFSAYSLFEGKGQGDEFRWTDPAPAGEEEPLLG